MTYLELKQKILDYTEVSSTVFTDTIIQGFIEDAEFRILTIWADLITKVFSGTKIYLWFTTKLAVA